MQSITEQRLSINSRHICALAVPTCKCITVWQDQCTSFLCHNSSSHEILNFFCPSQYALDINTAATVCNCSLAVMAVTFPLGIYYARKHQVSRHRACMMLMAAALYINPTQRFVWSVLSKVRASHGTVGSVHVGSCACHTSLWKIVNHTFHIDSMLERWLQAGASVPVH